MIEYQSGPQCPCPEDYGCGFDPEFYQEVRPMQCQPLPFFQIECIRDYSPGSFYDYGGGSCQPGTYSATTGAISCRKCPPGTASASVGATTCSDCKSGSFSAWGFTACRECPRNTYSDQPKAVGCSVCPTGKYANSAGSSACDSEPYCNAGFSTRLRTGYGEPICLCPKEFRIPGPYCIFDPEFYNDGSAELAWKACQPWIFFLIDCIRLPCAPGSYLSADGDGSCVECAPGTYSKTAEATACRLCPAGTASESAGATACADCRPGSYSSWGFAECYPCDRHTYTDRPGAARCAICPPGMYANTTGSTACDSGQYCEAGYRTEMNGYDGYPICLCPEDYTPDWEYQDLDCAFDPEFYRDGTPDPAQCQPMPLFQIECIAECSPGSFYDQAGGSCTECEPGTYSKTTGATACRPCPAGTASASAGATACSDCHPGSYSTWRSIACSRCDWHTYSNRPKAVNCAICPTGKYAGASGSTACNSGPYCAAGFSTKMTQLHGDPRGLCPEGYVLQGGEEPPCIYDPEFYIDGTPEQAQRQPIWFFQIECIPESFLDCPAGTFSDPANKRCSKCRAGKASARGAKKCSRCHSGSFSRPNPYSKVGANTCTVCPAGTASHPRRRAYSPTGSTGCKACRPGKYAPAGSKDCELCPSGKYAGGVGAVSCAACPTGKRATRPGSTACA